ncbi:hypothetical protein [Limnohabitans sp.]|uniref:hypothetical protein n=1 Tax=Limnohabitans sp. TaxID=1907725 RepID=UPI0033413ACC
MPNWKRAQQAKEVVPAFQLPFPWTMAPPWKQVTSKPKKEKVAPGSEERETQWVRRACNAAHHNPRKQACRLCGEARQQKQGGKAKGPPSQRASAKAPAAGQPARGDVSDEEERPLQIPKQLAVHLTKSGHKLHSVAAPDPAPEPDGSGHKKLEDLPTEQLQAAHDALIKVGMPVSTLQPYKDLLEDRKAKAELTYGPAKRLEHLTAARNRLAKRREEQQSEVDDQKARLARAESRLKKVVQDMDILQAEIAQAMAETNEVVSSVERAPEEPTGMRAVQTALAQPDEVLVQHPEYIKYATATAEAGGIPMQAIRWHLCRELGTLAAESLRLAAKRPCPDGAGRAVDADGDDAM